MAPTRMKLRVRRRDNAAGATGDAQPEQGEERSRDNVGRSSRTKNGGSASATPAAAASPSPPTSSASASVRAVMAAEDASPDSKCPICLDRFNNLAYLDRCLHRFCFPCIQEWSHNKPECPLCKQPFTSILHSVRAENDFKEYTLRPAPADSSIAATVAMVAAMASRIDHQMRLQLRRHRVEDGGETTTGRRRRERGGGGGGRRGGERSGVLEWYLDSNPLPHPPPHHLPAGTDDSDEAEHLEQQRLRGEADLAERGVIFEGLTGLGGAAAPVAPSDRASRRLMTRLASRQRTQREGGTLRRLRERETVAFRRALYRCGVRVRGVAGADGGQGQEQRDITAESFRQNSAHLNRLRPWLRRELSVLYGAHGVLVHIVQRIIMARLARHGLEDTPTIEEELRPFLLARTSHFLHELVSFARSPLSLDSYDLQAVYEPPLAGASSSSDSSSVIAISEGEAEERPGPSCSTADPSCLQASLSFSPDPQEGGGEAEEECLIVGYKKPIAERTPELVQLSSDTEEEEKKGQRGEVQERLSPLPPAAASPSRLSTVPPSTSGAYQDTPDDGVKERDADGQPSCARSWSGGSESVYALSPSERPRGGWGERKQSGSEATRERRRRRKRRRERERSSDWLRKSGTLSNPNRSIYPALMRRRSPPPSHSSVGSGSPLPPSPAESSWEYNCSPLTSSASSPSRSSSSSPLSSSPRPSLPTPPTPPTPSLSPRDPHSGEKPGGKRKYKSRHLDSNDKDPTWRPSREKRRKKVEKERRRRRRGRDEGKRRERQRRGTHKESGESSSRRCRDDRSPSVEIIYEGTISSEATQPPAGKRRRRRHRKTPKTSSPVIITLDSDSSHDDIINKRISSSSSRSSSSSFISSQQTVDFSDLPSLPLVHAATAGGGLENDIGDLPVDILDRGSDGSDTEPLGPSEAAGPIAVGNRDASDQEVDVETFEGSGSVPGGADKEPRSNTRTGTRETGGPEAAGADAEELCDPRGRSPPEPDVPLNFEPNCSPESRKSRFRNPCEVSWAGRHHSGSDPFTHQTTDGLQLPAGWPQTQHRDGGGLGVFPILPVKLHLPLISHTGPAAAEGPTLPPVDLHLAAELTRADQATLSSSVWSGHPGASSKCESFASAVHSQSTHQTSAPTNTHPVNSSPADFGWFHSDSTSAGCSVGQAPLGVRPPVTTCSAGVFSGALSNSISPLASLCPPASRTQNPDPPTAEKHNCLERLAAGSAPSGSLSAAEPERCGADSGLASSRELWVVSNEPVEPLSFTDGDHAALSLCPAEHTGALHASQRKCASHLNPSAASNAKLRNLFDLSSGPPSPTELQPHPKHSLTDVGNHVSSAHTQWNSNAADARPPADGCPPSVWNSHA